MPTHQNMLIFSGGTGSNTLVSGLIRAGYKPTTLLNAYDDGKSTGDIRHKFGILGPSDIAKNIAAMAPESIQKLFQVRLAKADVTLRSQFEAFIHGADSELAKLINELLEGVEEEAAALLRGYIHTFYHKMIEWEEQTPGEIYDLGDYGLRNIIYVGALFSNLGLHGEIDYNATNTALEEQLGLRGKILLNSSDSLWLVGVTSSGKLLRNEAAIVDEHRSEDIAEVFLLPELLSIEQAEEIARQGNVQQQLREMAVTPAPDSAAIDAIEAAETIIIAPTTFASSLWPTLMTPGIREALQQSTAKIIAVPNLIYERGTQTALDKLKLFHQFSGRWPDKILLDDRAAFVSLDGKIPVELTELSGYASLAFDSIVDQHGKHHADNLASLVIKNIIPDVFDNHAVKKEQLQVLVNNPLTYVNHQQRIAELCQQINGDRQLPLRVIVMGAGRGTRLGGTQAKILHHIDGQANLQRLLGLLSPFDVDHKPIVITANHNDEEINTAKVDGGYMTLPAATRGPGGSLLSVQQALINQFDGVENAIIVWGDWGGLVSNEQLAHLQAIHQASDSTVTLATALEAEPYAGVSRDAQGHVVGAFTTKGKPNKPAVGEHDGSLFIVNVSKFFAALESVSRLKQPGQEIGVLEAFRHMDKVTAVACLQPYQTLGYNTPADVDLLQAYTKTQRDSQDYDASLLVAARHFFSAPTVSHLALPQQSSAAKALVFDIDGTITNQDGKVDQRAIDQINRLTESGVKVAFITGRTMKSLKTLLLDELSLNENVYLFPENGAYGLCASAMSDKLYDLPIAQDVASAAIGLMRQHGLMRAMGDNSRDEIKVTNHKIQLWPKDTGDLLSLAMQLNVLFESNLLPIKAYIGSTDSILMSHYSRLDLAHEGGDVSTRYHALSEVNKIPVVYYQPESDKDPDLRIANKGTALRMFCQQVGMEISDVFKFGDTTQAYGADHAMMLGGGCYSVGPVQPAQDVDIKRLEDVSDVVKVLEELGVRAKNDKRSVV